MLALWLMVLAAYWPALSAGFIWDDNIFYESDMVRDWGGLFGIWFELGGIGAESHYWPMLYTSFWLDHKIWGGFHPTGFHLTNIVLHCANTALLWRLLVHMEVTGAWLIAAVFALHPLRVEAVAWVIARKDLLAMLFYLLAFACWLRFRRQADGKSYLALLGFYILALLSKTIAVTLPAILLVWAWWRHGAITKRDVWHTTPLFLIAFALGYYGLRFFTERTLIEFEYSLVERVVIAAQSLWFYAAKIVWPHPLLYIYNHWDVNPQRWINWVPLAGAIALALSLWWARGKIGRGPLAAALFFAITLSPVLGFVDNSYMKFAFVADRYQYLGGLGLLLLLIGGGAHVYRAHSERFGDAFMARAKPVAASVAAMALLACALLTFQRAHLFQDKVELFQNVVAHNPGAYEAYYNLGTFLLERGRPQQAVEAFAKGLEYEPFRIKMYVNLGSALMGLERHAEAEAVLRRAMQREPVSFEGLQDPYGMKYEAAGVRTNLGMALMNLGRDAEAEHQLRLAIELDPGMAQAKYNLVSLLGKQGRDADARHVLILLAKQEASPALYMQIAELSAKLGDENAAGYYTDLALAGEAGGADALKQQAAARFNAGRFEAAARLYQRLAELQPDAADNHVNHGMALARLGRDEQAQQSFERALALRPDYSLALTQLAGIHFNAGRYPEALQHYQRAIAVAPNDADALTNQGLVLARLGRGAEARQSLERALAIAPDHRHALTQLAAFYFNDKQFEPALRLFRRIVELNPASAEAHSNFGSALAQSGQMQAAVASFERALELDPASASARDNLALAKRQLQRGNELQDPHQGRQP